MRLSALSLLLLCACACDSEAERPAIQGACDFEEVHLVAESPELAFDAVTMVRRGTRWWAAWSEPKGSFVRELASDGAPRGVAQRITGRCRGGLDAAATETQIGLACLKPDGHAELWKLNDAGRALGVQALGNAGRDSQGIAVVPWGSGFAVAWHDGSQGKYTARWATLGKRGLSAARTMSDPAFIAGAPALAVHAGKLVGSWAEARFTADGQVATRVQVGEVGEPARSLGETSITDAAPQLTVDQGQLWVAFRDRRRSNQRAQFYGQRLAATLAPKGKPQRLGRANSDGPPRLVSCGDERFALTPRVYGGEMYIGVHSLKADLSHRGGGHQYYENSREFVRAAGACTDDGMLMLAAERAGPASPGVRAIAVHFRCAN